MHQPADFNWIAVKQQSLWAYEDLVKKLLKVLDYDFVRQHYPLEMHAAARNARLAAETGFLPGEGAAAWAKRLETGFLHLEAHGVVDCQQMITKAGTREDCTAFLDRTSLEFSAFIEILVYLLRWALPFSRPSRELLDLNNPVESAAYLLLKQHRLMSNLDLVERGRTPAARVVLAGELSLPIELVARLVMRADLARLPFVRGKTVLPLCGAGYDSWAKVAAADLSRMEADLEKYFRSQGKSFADYKSAIVLSGIVRGANFLPPVVQEQGFQL